MSVFLLMWYAALPYDLDAHCAWREPTVVGEHFSDHAQSPHPHLSVNPWAPPPRTLSMMIVYSGVWAECARLRGGEPPRLTADVVEETGLRRVMDVPLSLSTGVSPSQLRTATHEITGQCVPAHPRSKHSVRRDYFGGIRPDPRWFNLVTVVVRVHGKGPYAALAFEDRAVVLCEVKSDGKN